ncbi:MAG: DUF192 domain-containing protein [Deltaproteobacteria bacterium]|nr:DUF192 domain-containing protein [Deltaproteobacteria bacterium]
MPLLLLIAAGCLHPDRLPTLPLEVGGHGVRAEVADTPELRARGLMYRDAIGPDEGMLFVYPASEALSFWMENTRIPLTIAFVSASGEIVRLRDLAPFDRTSVSSGAPALYALEMNRGWFDANGVGVGARVEGLPGPSER